jgi:ABC-type oligopeptide transport system substrate-binding subunit
MARFSNGFPAAFIEGSPAPVTGPFQIAKWEAKTATLIPNEAYWGARPYLDAIEIQMGRDLKTQALDLSLNKIDITETGDRGGALKNTLALVFGDEHVPVAVREALSLAVDRPSIQRVLAKSGEAAWSLLPNWLSGYAFVFRKERDVTRAKQLAQGASPLTFAYDREDLFLRRIAERLTVSAMDAGISLRPAVNGTADVRLENLPITINDEFASLADIAAALKLPLPATDSSAEAERKLLEGFRVIPVIHIPDSWAVSPRVHNWPDIPNVWMSPASR